MCGIAGILNHGNRMDLEAMSDSGLPLKKWTPSRGYRTKVPEGRVSHAKSGEEAVSLGASGWLASR